MEPRQWWGLNLTVVLRVIFLASCDAGDSAIALISMFVLDGEKKRERVRGRGHRQREKNIGFLSHLKGHNLSCSNSQF